MVASKNKSAFYLSVAFTVACWVGSKWAYDGLKERWDAVLYAPTVHVTVLKSFYTTGKYPSPMWLVRTPQGRAVETVQFRCADGRSCRVYLTKSDRIIPAETSFDTAIALLEVTGLSMIVFLTALIGPFALLIFWVQRKNSPAGSLLDFSPFLNAPLSLIGLSLTAATGAIATEMFRTERYVPSVFVGLLAACFGVASFAMLLIAGFQIIRRLPERAEPAAPHVEPQPARKRRVQF